MITPKDHHIRAYWRATAAFEEREYILKIIIIIFIVTGGRPSDILAPEFDAREDIEFGEDPIITFKIRKNNDETDLPDEVPLMGCCEILKKHIKKLESGTVPYIDADGENWDGSLLPAVDDCSGSMSDQSLRNWLQEVEEVADTNYGRNGDDYIKPKAWRSRWFTEYRSALSTIRPRQKLVADDQGSSNIDLAEDAYVDNKQIRSEIRAEAREEIISVLPDQEIPTMNEASNSSTRVQTLDDAIQRSKSEQSSSSNHAILPLVPITIATTLADMMRYKHKSDHTGQSISSVPPLTSKRRLLRTKLLVMLTMVSAGIQMSTTDGLLPIAYGTTLVIAWAVFCDIDELSPEAYSVN